MVSARRSERRGRRFESYLPDVGEKRYIDLHYTLYVDVDDAEERSEDLLNAMDLQCGCVSGGDCDLVAGSVCTLTPEQFEERYADEADVAKDARPRRRRRTSG